MTRVTCSVVRRAKHKKILKSAKGYIGRSKNCFRIALQRVEKARQYQYRDRKARKRQMRALWIQRLNAAVRAECNMSYSQFIHRLAVKKIALDRKVLSDMAIKNKEAFRLLLKELEA